jgi:hypothetical protein
MNNGPLVPEFFVGFEILIIIFPYRTKIKKRPEFQDAWFINKMIIVYPKATLLNSVTFTSPFSFR